MRAAVCTKYGPPEGVIIQEVATPAPKADEVLVRIHASTVASGDCRVRGCRVPAAFWLPMRLMLGVRRPRQPILGTELSGRVEAVGTAVRRFRPGDAVFALTGMRFGGHAEYIALPENGPVAPAPANLALDQAAAIAFGGTSALYFLRKAGVRAGEKALVYGASGAVGTYAVQLARQLGAEVTGVCGGDNLDLVRSLGAQQVIDYTREDFRRQGTRYDVILDAVGKLKKGSVQESLRPAGRFVTAAEGYAPERLEDLLYLRELVESGEIRPVVDRTYPLDHIADAYRYVDTGHKKGNVVLTMP